MKVMKHLALAVPFTVLFASAAFAHPGHGGATDMSNGFMHPLSGLDHILAMIAVGLYAAQLGGRSTWMLPAAFVSAMIAGGAMGYAGLSIPMVEQGIALSVIVMGVAIALGLKMPADAGMALVAGFAIFHGHAHGSEGAEAASFAPYAAGFIATTVLLHAVGVMLGRAIDRLEASQSQLIRQLAGSVGAVTGIALLAG
jgi:urease accessory protein